MALTPPPVPTQNEIADNYGRVTRPWIAFFTNIGKLLLAPFKILSDGSELPIEGGINFSSDFTVADDADGGVTTVALAQKRPTPQRRDLGMTMDSIYLNDADTVLRAYVTLTLPSGAGGTASVYSENSPNPGTIIGRTSVLNGPSEGSIAFEVMPHEYYQIRQDSNLRIEISTGVQDA